MQQQSVPVLQAYRTALQVEMVPPFNLTGSVEIDVHSSAPTHCVVLHAVGMELDSFTASPQWALSSQVGPCMTWRVLHNG